MSCWVGNGVTSWWRTWTHQTGAECVWSLCAPIEVCSTLLPCHGNTSQACFQLTAQQRGLQNKSAYIRENSVHVWNLELASHISCFLQVPWLQCICQRIVILDNLCITIILVNLTTTLVNNLMWQVKLRMTHYCVAGSLHECMLAFFLIRLLDLSVCGPVIWPYANHICESQWDKYKTPLGFSRRQQGSPASTARSQK